MGKYIALGAFVIACAYAQSLAAHGQIELGIVCALSPALLALAVLRPVLFPYAAYAILVPLDTLLSTGSEGTIPKVLGMCSGLAFAAYVLRKQAFVMPSRANLASIAFVVAFAASLLWTIDPDTGHMNLQTLAELVLVYTCASIVPMDRFDIKGILGAIVLGGVGVAFYGIWTFRHGEIPGNIDVQGARLLFAVGDKTLDINTYADSMVLPIGIALWVWIVESSAFRRALALIAIATMTYAVLLAASRDALIAIAILLAYTAWRSPARKRLWPLGIVLVGGSLLHASVWQRFGEAEGSGGAGRFSIWHVGLRAFEARPFFGWGGGSFSSAYDRFYLSVYQNYNAGWDRAAHNLLLHYGVEMGIFGMLCVVAVWLQQIREARALEAYPAMRELGIALTGVLLALAFASLFIDLFWAKILWLAFGVVGQARAYALYSRLEYEPRKPRPKRVRIDLRRYAPGLAASALALLAFSLPHLVRAADVPHHVKTYLYYGAQDVNKDIPAAFMARNADFVEADWSQPQYVRAYKDAGGAFALEYVDPTFVPYCKPPFTGDDAGRCDGPLLAHRAVPESSFLHDASGARLHRSDSYTREYRDALDPASAGARAAFAVFTADLAAQAPVDGFFSDESGSEWSGDYFGFGTPAEIRTASEWIAAERGMLEAAAKPLILNGGGNDWGPAYGGAFLDLPSVLGETVEGCFANDSVGIEGVRYGYWPKLERALHSVTAHRRYAICMMNGRFTPDIRSYALASWWLTYDPRWSVAAPVTPASDGHAVYPEYELVPREPLQTMHAQPVELKRDGIYAREFAACYQGGRAIGRCAAIVNPSAASVSVPRSVRERYPHALSLGDRSLYAGGTISWQSTPAELHSLQGTIVHG